VSGLGDGDRRRAVLETARPVAPVVFDPGPDAEFVAEPRRLVDVRPPLVQRDDVGVVVDRQKRLVRPLTLDVPV
jgi:hypothetical protein